MCNESENNNIRNGVLIGLFVFILSTPLGYFFNYYFNKDDITIENVELVPEFEKLNFNRDLYSEIENLKGVMYSFGGNINQEYSDELSEYERNLLLHQLKIDMRKTSSNIKKMNVILDKINKDDLSVEVQNWTRLNIPYYLIPPNEKITKKNLLEQINFRIKSLEKLTEKLELLINQINSFKKNRNGDCKITMTFLNSGNTDGLIRPEGQLILDGYDESISLKILKPEFNSVGYTYFPVQTNDKENSTAVSKRSMVNITFVIDEDEVKKGILEEFQAILKSKQGFKFRVKVTDFRGDEYLSKMYMHSIR